MFGFLKGKKEAVDTLPPPKLKEGKPIDTARRGRKFCPHCNRFSVLCPNSYYCNHPDYEDVTRCIFRNLESCNVEPCLEEDWKRCPLNEEREVSEETSEGCKIIEGAASCGIMSGAVKVCRVQGFQPGD